MSWVGGGGGVVNNFFDVSSRRIKSDNLLSRNGMDANFEEKLDRKVGNR